LTLNFLSFYFFGICATYARNIIGNYLKIGIPLLLLTRDTRCTVFFKFTKKKLEDYIISVASIKTIGKWYGISVIAFLHMKRNLIVQDILYCGFYNILSKKLL